MCNSRILIFDRLIAQELCHELVVHLRPAHQGPIHPFVSPHNRNIRMRTHPKSIRLSGTSSPRSQIRNNSQRPKLLMTTTTRLYDPFPYELIQAYRHVLFLPFLHKIDIVHP